MSTIDPAELSALIDGELDPERAAEVRAAAERDPVLKADLARLCDLDDACRAVASSAAFRPTVSVPAARPAPLVMWLAPALIALLLLRLAPVLLNLALFDLAVHVVALGVMLVWIVRLTAGDGRGDDVRAGFPLGKNGSAASRAPDGG